MPLYEYHCPDCQSDFEKMVSFAEATAPQPCPVCEGQQTQKKISRVAGFHTGAGSSAPATSNCAPGGRFR